MTLRQWIYRNIYLRTSYWQWVRRKIGARAKWKCQVRGCKENGHHLDVHHTTYSILWLEWLFPQKMFYLCRNHHQMTHKGFTLRLKNSYKPLCPFGYKK